MIAAEVFIFILLALLFGWGGFQLGKLRGRGPGRRAVANTSQCPCGHQWGAHHKTGDCQDKVYRSGDGWRKCPCTKYHGPEVLMASDFFGPGAINQ